MLAIAGVEADVAASILRPDVLLRMAGRSKQEVKLFVNKSRTQIDVVCTKTLPASFNDPADAHSPRYALKSHAHLTVSTCHGAHQRVASRLIR